LDCAARPLIHRPRSPSGTRQIAVIRNRWIDPALLEQFDRNMREKSTSGSIPFRKAHLHSLIDVIDVNHTKPHQRQ
jgi:hypothetical protein